MKLYSYWQSSTSYRVRIALHLKGIPFDQVTLDLAKGDHRHPDYARINPMQGVPALEIGDGALLTQSLAILRYLDHAYPSPRLIPNDPVMAARVDAAALVIATDIHPVNNRRVGQHLRSMGHGDNDLVDWMNHWMREGLVAFDALIDGGAFCFGTAPSLADVCLIPQLHNAHRWGTDLEGLDRLQEIEQNCLDLKAFQLAHPDAQPDAT